MAETHEMSDLAVKQEFVKRLIRAMSAKGWNQSELAREATKHIVRATGDKKQEVTRDIVSRYINGQALPGPARLKAMAAALDLEPVDLVPRRRHAQDLTTNMSLSMTSGGAVRLTIDREVPLELATKIMKLLGEANVGDDDNGSNGEPKGVKAHRRAVGSSR